MRNTNVLLFVVSMLVEPNRIANDTISTSQYMYFAPLHTTNKSVTMPALVPHALSRDSEHAEMAAAPGSGRAEGLSAANQAGSGGRTVGGLGLALARCPLSQALRETTNLRSPSCVSPSHGRAQKGSPQLHCSF